MIEKTTSFTDADASYCRSFMNGKGSGEGICLGDSQTQPMPDAFDASALAASRGFMMLVTRADMKIVWATNAHNAANQALDASAIDY